MSVKLKEKVKKGLSYTPFYPIYPAGSYLQYLYFWRAIKRLPTHRFKNALEAGFGPGHYAKAFARKFPHIQVTGYDIAPSDLSNAPSNLSLQKKDLNEMSEKNSYDFLYSIEVLEHIKDNQPIINKFYDALKPGGYLYIHMPYEPLTRWILPSSWFKRYNAWAQGEHVGQQYSLGELSQLLADRGFIVQDATWTFGRPGEILDELDELVRQTFPRGFKYIRYFYAPVMKGLCQLVVKIPWKWGNVMVTAQKPATDPANPLISVVICTYNSAHLVGNALQSVLNQTYQNFEIIIIDEASKDDIESVVNSFKDSRIRLIRYEKNTGLPAARNRGIEQSKGEVIAFLDSDDSWAPKKLEKQWALMKDKPSVGVVYCGIEYRRGNEVLGHRFPQYRGNIIPHLLAEHVVGNATTYLIRKECFDKYGMFDESLRTYGEDWDLMLRFARHYDFDFCPEPVANYYFHTTHKSGELVDRPVKSVPDRLKIIEANKDLYAKYPKALAFVYRRLGVDFCKAGQNSVGRSYFWKSFKLNPLSVKNILAYVFSFINGKRFYQLWLWMCVKRKKTHAVALTQSVSGPGVPHV